MVKSSLTKAELELRMDRAAALADEVARELELIQGALGPDTALRNIIRRQADAVRSIASDLWFRE